MSDRASLVSEIDIGDGLRDAFARLRTSDPQTIFDNTFQYDTSPIQYEKITTGSGSIVHWSESSAVVLKTNGTTANDSAILQQRQYNRYQPGKSQLVISTAIFPEKQTNLRTRLGYFDPQGGLYFEQDSVGLKIVQRNTVNGQVVNTEVRQGDWNSDNVDGTKGSKNPSGMTIDTQKLNIYWIDMEWLGGGTVRCGVFYKGMPIILHSFNNENTKTQTYMPTGNLPLRYENVNTGATQSPSQFSVVCQSVISEGGFENERGNVFSVNNGVTAVSASGRRAVLSIRPKASFNSIPVRALIEPLSFDLTVATNNVLYELVYNPTFTVSGGALTWTSANDNSIVEYSRHGDANNGSFTNGIVLQSGYLLSGNKANPFLISNDILSKYPIVRDHNGENPIALSLVVTPTTGSSTALGSITFKEIR